jgi:hypothetical protein
MSFCYGDIHGPSWKRHNPAPPPTTTEEGENSSKAHYQDKRISVSLTNQDLGDGTDTQDHDQTSKDVIFQGGPSAQR